LKHFAFGLSVLLATVLATGCDHPPPKSQGAKTVEVFVTTPITSKVADYQDFTGRLEAVKTVDIRARVTGYVLDAPFKEGDQVREGDLLFQIDAQTYKADLNQAEANLKLAHADRKLQERTLDRARIMIANKSIGREEFDQDVAAMEKSRATVGAMEAARDRCQLYVGYTRVTSPVTGRISRRYVDPGNLVNADNTVLTTVVTENPLHASFDVDERTYLELLGPGQGGWFSGHQLPVLMKLVNEDDFSRSGTINFIDNRVIATSGTVRMRGVFENAGGALKPGLFVRVRLPLSKPYKAILISDEALLSDQGRKYVYVVNGKNEVEYRSVKLGQAIQGLRVIKEGLTAGEQVIVSGLQRVRPGVQVQVKMQYPPEAPESPLVRLLAGVRSQESGVRSQESGVRGQESGVPSTPDRVPSRVAEPGVPGANQVGSLP
jgi:RND family efflux transporter MFP subunit